MMQERDIEMILSNLKIRPDAKARQAAFERMMSRRAEVLAAGSGRIGDMRFSLRRPKPLADAKESLRKRLFGGGELSCDELAMAAGGVAGGTQNEENDFYDPEKCYKKTRFNQPCDCYDSSTPKCIHFSATMPFSNMTIHYVCKKGYFDILVDGTYESKAGGM